jgi:succinate-acetate transporter protein
MIAAAGVANFDHAFAAWLIMWALFTATFAVAATTISWTAVAPFALAIVVLVVLAIANLGGTASWTADVAKVGGWFALLDSFAAGYLGAALVVNISTGKPVMPLFPTNLWKS